MACRKKIILRHQTTVMGNESSAGPGPSVEQNWSPVCGRNKKSSRSLSQPAVDEQLQIPSHIGMSGSMPPQDRKLLRTGSAAASTAGDTNFFRGAQRSETLANTLLLTPYQQKLLTQNWPRIYATGGSKIGHEIFNELSSRNPVANDLFQKASIVESFHGTDRHTDCRKDHAKWLGDLFDRAIKSLNRPVEDIAFTCQEYGLSHKGLKTQGLNTRLWDELGDVLLEYVRRNDAVRKHRELARAWASLISFLMEKIKEGQEIGLRRRSFVDLRQAVDEEDEGVG